MRRPVWLPLLFFVVLCLLTPNRCMGFRHLIEGEPVPALSLRDLEGKSHSLADNKGKVLLIIYWRPGQDRSLDALKDLKVISEQFKDKPFSILAITKDTDNLSALKEVKKSLELPFPLLLDSKEDVYSRFGVFVFPCTALIDKKGIYRFHYGGFREDFRETIAKQLKVLLGIMPEEALKSQAEEQPPHLTEEQKRAENHLNLAKTLEKRGMDDSALEEFKKAAELDPANSEAHILLGFALLDQKEIDQAVNHLSRGMELNPKSADAKIGLGRAYRMKGETDKALRILQAELDLCPDSAAIHLELGEVYESLGRTDQAMKHYKAAAEYALKKGESY